jgi:hypothetical protein
MTATTACSRALPRASKFDRSLVDRDHDAVRQGRHIESTTQVATTTPTNPRPLLDRFARLEKSRIQSTESHPLARVQHIGQHGEFTQNLQSAGFSNAGRS